jgi:hypothetical protein
VGPHNELALLTTLSPSVYPFSPDVEKDFEQGRRKSQGGSENEQGRRAKNIG